MEKPQKKLLDALILVKAAWVSAYRGIAKPILKGANYQFLADTDGEIKIHEELQIIPPKININSEIGMTRYQVESPIEVIENSFYFHKALWQELEILDL